MSDLQVYSREGEGWWRCAQQWMKVAQLIANLKIMYGLLGHELAAPRDGGLTALSLRFHPEVLTPTAALADD